MLVIMRMLFIERNDSFEPDTINLDIFSEGSLYEKIPNANNVIKPEKIKRYKPL